MCFLLENEHGLGVTQTQKVAQRKRTASDIWNTLAIFLLDVRF